MAISLVTDDQIETLASVAARLDAKGLVDESRVLRAVLAELAPRGAGVASEVPASAAARILAVTPQTIRNWVRADLLPGRRDRTGHFLVELDALEPALRMQRAMPDAPAGAISDDVVDAEITAVRNTRRAARGKQSPRSA